MDDTERVCVTTKTTTTTITTQTTETKELKGIKDTHHSYQQPAARALSASGIFIPNPIKAALVGVPAKNYFVHADEVITIQSREKIPAAVQTLVDFGISSAPVIDDTGKCIGLFDMADVLDFVLKIFEETSPLGDNFMAQLEQTTRMCIEACSTIVGLSKRDKYCPVTNESPLVDAINLLDSHNVHRVPVVDVTGQITSLITQSGVLRWFAYNMERLGSISTQKVQDLMLGYKPVVMINGNEPAIEAFRLMQSRGISSVAVVDKELRLLTVVSTSDLKGVTRDPVLISRLHLPVLSYLTLLYPEGSHPPVVCSVTDTVERVMETLVSKKIHRVYLVDSNHVPVQSQQPVGVISLRDVIHALMKDDYSNFVF
jgi:CBS domain-containing protein